MANEQWTSFIVKGIVSYEPNYEKLVGVLVVDDCSFVDPLGSFYFYVYLVPNY